MWACPAGLAMSCCAAAETPAGVSSPPAPALSSSAFEGVLPVRPNASTDASSYPVSL
jgi:hypothetical protein